MVAKAEILSTKITNNPKVGEGIFYFQKTRKSMYVVKRDGHKEPVSFDKITDRIKKLCYGLNDLVDAVKVAMRVIEGLYDGVTTSELDNLPQKLQLQ